LKNLTAIAIFCVFVPVFAVAVDQPAADNALSSREFVTTASYVNNAVSQIFRTLSVFYYALLASSANTSNQTDDTGILTPVSSKSADAEVPEAVPEDGFVLSVDKRKATLILVLKMVFNVECYLKSTVRRAFTMRSQTCAIPLEDLWDTV